MAGRTCVCAFLFPTPPIFRTPACPLKLFENSHDEPEDEALAKPKE